MHLRTVLTQALAFSMLFLRAAAVDVAADESAATTEKVVEEPIFRASASFPAENPLSHVVNGQRNVIEILVENKSPNEVLLQSISGSLTNAKTGDLLRNTTAQKLGISIGPGNGFKLPYAFHSEFKPTQARLKIFVDYEQEKVPAQLVAYDGLVSIVEPAVSFFDWRVLSTYAFVLALLGGAGYFTYLNFFPAPKKKTKAKATPVGPVDTPVTPGSGVYSEEWIPAHHIKKPKTRKDIVSSGDESEARRRRR